MLMYDNREEASARLNNTIINCDGVGPVYVNEIYHNNEDGNPWFLLYTVQDKTPLRVSMKDPRLNWREYNLGMINLANSTLFASRLPIRGGGFRQGLHRGNVKLVNLETGEHPFLSDITFKKGLAECLTNRYPSFREAVAFVNKPHDPFGENSPKIRAFHQNFAVCLDKLRGDYVLLYKGQQKIAWGDPDVGFVLPKQFKHLQETLIEIGVRIVNG